MAKRKAKRRTAKQKLTEIADAKDILKTKSIICPHCGKTIFILL